MPAVTDPAILAQLNAGGSRPILQTGPMPAKPPTGYGMPGTANMQPLAALPGGPDDLNTIGARTRLTTGIETGAQIAAAKARAAIELQNQIALDEYKRKAAMDNGTAPMSTQDRRQLQSSGVPVLAAPYDPFNRIKDPKQLEMARRQSLTSGTQFLQKQQEAASTARAGLQPLAEFNGLNAQGDTGSWQTYFENMMPTTLQPDWLQRMNQISTGMGRAMRQPGEGTMSDFDARQFQKMVGGPNMSQETNQKFSSAAMAAKQAIIDRNAFNEAFLQANGTTLGADRMWNQYNAAEPIFDQKGAIRQRMPWDQYFSTRAQNALGGQNYDRHDISANSTVSSGGQTVSFHVPDGASDEDVAALAKEAMGKAGMKNGRQPLVQRQPTVDTSGFKVIR